MVNNHNHTSENKSWAVLLLKSCQLALSEADRIAKDLKLVL